MPSRVPLLYGSASFGEEGKHVARLHTLPECQEVVDLFVGRGYTLFDCARGYGYGTSEEYLGKLDLKGARVDTKLFPIEGCTPENLRKAMNESLKALGPHKIRVLYLHGPDRKVPWADQLRAIDSMYKEGFFEEFGLSNFYSWEVAEIVTLAKDNGWVKPTVYQGIYNVLERTIEPELIPCLKTHGLRYYAYSPLASGILVGKLMSEADLVNSQGSRWDPKNAGRLATMLRTKYAPLLPILKPLKETLEKHDITLSAAALRWLQHHSKLTEEDGVIIGGRSVEQVRTNIDESEQGPLPAEIIEQLDQAWYTAMPKAGNYAFAG